MFGPAASARPTPSAATAASATTATAGAIRAKRGFMVLAPPSGLDASRYGGMPSSGLRGREAGASLRCASSRRRRSRRMRCRQIFEPTSWYASGSREIVAPDSDATAALPPRRSRDAALGARVGGRGTRRLGLLLPLVRDARARRRLPALAAARARPARIRGIELLAGARPVLELGSRGARGPDGGHAPRRHRRRGRLVVGEGLGRERAPRSRRRRGARG